MDNLHKEQLQRFEEIQHLLTNYKKDSIKRKTPEYIQRKIGRLEDIYQEFLDADDEILKQFKTTYPKHPYWNARDAVAPVVQNFRKELEALRGSEVPGQQTSQQTSDPGSSAGAPFNINPDDEKISPTQAKRYKAQNLKMRQFHAIVREAQYSVENEPDNIELLTIKLEKISSKLTEIEKLHEEIYIEGADDEETTLQYFKDDYFGTVTRQYENIKVKVMAVIKKQPTSSNRQCPSNMPKLPRIQIPTFDGNFKNWSSFINTFNNLVHENMQVSDFEKLSYFKESLKGEPSTLIGHLALQASNYQTAYDIIKERYDNKRKIVAEYIDAILNIPKVQPNAAKDIKRMHDTLKECTEALRNLSYNVDEWSTILIHITTKKLDYGSLKHYEESLHGSREFPSMEQFLHLLMERMNVLEVLHGAHADQTKQPRAETHRKVFVNQKKKLWHGKELCNYCEENGHAIPNCIHFKQITPSRRIDFINRKKLCTNCLLHNPKEACLKPELCPICNNKHHQLLHTYSHDIKKKVSVNAMDGNFTTLLSTAKITTKTLDNKTITLRALIDLGSQVSLITEDACQKVGLQQTKVHTSLIGIGGNTKNTCNSIVQLEIQPHFSSSFKLKIEAYVLRKITSNVPEQKIKRNNDNRWKDIILADPQYDCPAPIDVLLGADVYAEISESRIIKGNPSAMKTNLGWIIVGPATTVEFKTPMVHTSVKEELTQAQELHKFWELEESPVESPRTEAEEQCEVIYQQTVQRQRNGRYIVTLPFKGQDAAKLGASKQRATQRFLQIEKRLQKNDQLRQLYVRFMREYEELGHMRRSYNSKGKFYIPHHAIIKETSEESKFRVVFDASMKSTSGISLNDTLHIGTTLQTNLWSLLLRWRKHKIVFGADIIKMYRQIEIAKEHQDYQRIIWRENPDQPLREYNLATVTYGTTAAPFLALRTLHQLATDEGRNYPLASKALRSDCYVDDVLTGSDNIGDALILQKQLIRLLRTGQFQLSKWSSNHPKLLKNIETANQLVGNLELSEDETIKTLGIHWNPTADYFKFCVNKLTSNINITKRQLASEVAKQFDPIGWLAPVTITSKLILQQLWTTQLKWDEKVPQEIAAKWVKLRDEMVQLETITIPRWIGTVANTSQTVCLHGFCDASESAYAAVVYSHIESSDGSVITRLLTAKTKVAPIRVTQTLPRLELCGAVLLARLINQVANSLEVRSCNVYTWTDSKIVLAWLQKPAIQWKTFVSNRVSEIQSTTTIQNWNYVPSAQNPADHASRGISPSKLSTLEQWWNGPQIIRKPFKQQHAEMLDTTVDMKKTKILVHVLEKRTSADNPILELVNRKSEYMKLLRITAYICRFISKIKKISTSSDQIRTPELKVALSIIIKAVQEEAFPYELINLRDKKSTTKNSTIASLNPFLDHEGLIRVGGRLTNSDLPFGEKHPLILPAKSHFTRLIINWAHTQTLHGTKALTLAFIRKTFWIIRGGQVVRNHIKRCVICFRFQCKPTEQLMGNLPKPRVTPSRPFTYTGVDYAGPLNIRVSKGRGNRAYKGYIAVFVCLSTKAVHLEVVSDLTANTFLAAFKRFTARRGNISHIYSDNGTNFIKANKILIQNQRQWEENIQNHFAAQNITWHFIPPSAPHFGGLWEAAVKSLKHHLCRVIGDRTFTFEELSTMLCMIEACLNSRPLCVLSNDLTDINVITSGHFLIGNALLAPPEPDLVEKNTNILTRWELVNQMHQRFWKIWHQDYLAQLQHRYKWKNVHPNLNVGDIVLIKEDNLPPLAWAKGRVKEIHPGKDDLVRAATVVTSKGEYKRPTTKLCLIPTAQETENYVPSSDENYTTRLRSRLGRRTKVALTFLTLLSICMVTVPVNTYPTQIKLHELDTEGGIYFDNIGNVQLLAAHWNLIIRYNLKNYWNELTEAEMALEHLNKSCNNIQTIHCKVILQQLQGGLAHIKDENKLFEVRTKKHRKRGLGDTIGILLSDTLGILSQREADHYENQFALIDQNEQHLLQLTKQQTSIIDNTIRLFKQNNNYTVTHMRQIEEHQQQVDFALLNMKDDFQAYVIHQITQRDYVITGMLQLMLMLHNLEETQQNIIGIMLNTQHNTLHRSLLSPLRLQEEIHNIREHVSPMHSLPGKGQGNLIQLYRLLKTESIITNNNIIIRVRLPLVNIQPYQLFALISIPISTTDGQISIIPSSEYLVVDHQREHYAPINRDNFKQCLPMQGKLYVCKISPIYTKLATTAQCEMNMLLRKHNMHSNCSIQRVPARNLWIPLHESNQWIYITKSKSMVTFDLICESHIVPLTLQGIGMISVQPGCIIKDETLQIASIGNEVTNINTSFLATANISQINDLLHNVTSLQHYPDKSISTTASSITTVNLREIEEQLEVLKSQEVMNNHHIHHYTMTHITFGSVLIIITVAIIFWIRRRSVHQAESRNAPIALPRTSLSPAVCSVEQ